MDTDVDIDETNLKDEEQVLIAVENTLSTVEESMCKFIKDVPEALAASGLEVNLEKLNIDDGKKILQLLHPFPKSFTDLKANKEEEKEKLSALERECEQLRGQLQQQIDGNKRAQEEIKYLREQILNQSTYCASLGAVLSNLSWRASRSPEIVDVWLSGFQHKIDELLSITDGSFVAFMNTYRDAFPPTCNVEYEFISGLLGIVTNISATPEGREFLITNRNGRDFVQKMIKLMPALPVSQGSLSLQKLMLMIFYNVSMNKTGLQHLFESQIWEPLNYYLRNNSLPSKLQLLCLRILLLITYDLTNPKYIQKLTTTLPLDRIEDIAASNDNGMSTVAKQVIKHLRDSQKFLSSN
ncbi:heat shock factor 2-binding protein [Osmia lignaria lignaria]|uniref:heat shock factor 2-binding protein n=1 Tax=Osmia lignaria lignaria TaxID=1437193 RepID=UPI001479807E|nr:heat shock factor 2-binding protein-like [Osmia lignaria]XP_034177134.1 heat shock factor 2-binding protein-like [Osmia lignaria]